ncbi:MAG TPA: penicillin-binding protein 2 [Actinomycetota bacterium]|nr:penicillin-binding protein 2 [Actinomycetota bacterium]
MRKRSAARPSASRNGSRNGRGSRSSSSSNSSRNGRRPPAGRLIALLTIMALAFAGILVRLVVLQVRDASEYRTLAKTQRLRRITVPATRGTIFDRNGEELAMSVPAKAVFVDPQLVQNAASEASVVSTELGLPYARVYAAMTRPGRFVYLARGVDLDVASRLESRRLPGIGFLDESRRRYPSGTLASHVLGFVGVDGNGLSGLELEHDELLAGRAGRKLVEADPTGRLIPQASTVERRTIPGRDLVLTIDREIQYRAQAALEVAVLKNRAKAGTVIVMDPKTGEILAMATYPGFDPNRFSVTDPAYTRNRAVTDVYEPGSVNKVVTAAAAIEEGVLGLKERLVVPWQYRLYDKTFHDSHWHPVQRMTLGDILTYSSNIGAIQVARLLGEERLSTYLRRFGLGSRTGVGFPGESGGIVPPVDEWSGTSIGSVPIGQSVAVTPLQMLSVYTTIANNGVWVRPTLVRATEGDGGERIAPGPAPTRRVISERTAEVLTRMLAFAVDVGTGKEAQIPWYWVAGKTGTAKKPREDGPGYSREYVASFIGFVPASRPAVAVAAVLDEPQTVFGGVAAAPLFREIAQFSLGRLRIPHAPKPPAPAHALTPS